MANDALVCKYRYVPSSYSNYQTSGNTTVLFILLNMLRDNIIHYLKGSLESTEVVCIEDLL